MTHPDTQNYGNICSYRMAGLLDNPLRRLLHNPQKILGGLVREGQAVADFGCGPGYFSLAMARMVGPVGRVYTVDLQPEMLEIVRKKAAREGLLPRLVLHQCEPDRLGLEQPLDFALAFWMLHEVRSPDAFLGEVAGMLKPGGRFLLVEPLLHVNTESFQTTVARVRAAGLVATAEPKVRISRAVVFQKQ